MPEPQKDTQETGASVPPPSSVITPATNTSTDPPSPAPANISDETPAPEINNVSPDRTPVEPSFMAIEEESINNPKSPTIHWAASEFHAHEKTVSWYIILGIATVVLAILLYLFTRSAVTPVVVIISGLVLGVYGTHRPNQIEYAINDEGIRIGSKQYPYDEFRLFIVTPESSLPEVTLIPVKRFMPSLSLRYTEELENEVLDILAAHLPFEERHSDFVDNLMRRLHF